MPFQVLGLGFHLFLDLGLIVTEIDIKKVQKQDKKIVGMACQKVCNQGSDDVKVNTKLYPYIFLQNSCTLVWKRCRDGALYTYLHFYIIPTLFAYLYACHPYIF